MELQLYNAQRRVTAIYGNQAFTFYSIASGLSPGQGLAHIRNVTVELSNELYINHLHYHLINKCIYVGYVI